MKAIAVLSLTGSLFLGVAAAQTSATSQTDASASQSTSASASKSGAQVDSTNSSKAAQSAKVSNQHAQAATANQLQSGSTIHAALDKPVDARKSKPGDQVVAKTTEDVKQDGKVVIPRGSKIVGHVTEAKAHESGQAESAVGVVFDHAVLKDGSEVPMSLAVQAVGNSAASAAAQAQDDSLMSSPGAIATGSMSGTASGATRTGGGLVGGVHSTTGGLVNTAGSVGGSTVHSATGVGGAASSSAGAASSSLTSSSQGVVGLQNLNLASSAANANSGTFTSRNSNVHLDSGTQMILRVQK